MNSPTAPLDLFLIALSLLLAALVAGFDLLEPLVDMAFLMLGAKG